MKYAPLTRIILRYIVGAGLVGSNEIGRQLAADPDLVFYASMALGSVVEFMWIKVEYFKKKKEE